MRDTAPHAEREENRVNMPSLSFSGKSRCGEFWKLIKEEKKTMTTRYPRKRGSIQAGDTVALYWKQRTPIKDKPIHLIGYASVKYIYHARSLTDAITHIPDYAEQEGFGNLQELVNYWGFKNVVAARETGPLEVIVWQTPIMTEKPRM